MRAGRLSGKANHQDACWLLRQKSDGDPSLLRPNIAGMEVPLPRGVSFRADLRLLIWQPRGILDEAQVENLLAALEHAEDEAEMPFNRYTDLAAIDAVDLRFEYIFRVSLYRRLVYAKRTPVK